jgi:Ca2+-binding RTX toxin-like protein
LSTDVENLTLTGGAVSGTGNSLDNRLIGNGNSNVLDGGAGADTMIGGLGDDVYYVDHIGDVVSENAREGTDLI